MLHVGKAREAKIVNFLKSGKVTNFTMQVDNTHAQYDKETGIVPAGAIYEDTGILFNDAYVADGPQPVAVIVEGHILNERLPKQVEADAIKTFANRGLYFYDGEGKPII